MRRIGTFLAVFALWTLFGALSKVAFLAAYQSQMDSPSVGDWFAVLWHGLQLDVAVAGYLTLLPGLLLVLRQWWGGSTWRWAWRLYFASAALGVSLAYVGNLGLYGYWGFPLDNTPLLYIRTSPRDALASLSLWQLLLAPVAVMAVGMAMYRAFPLPRRRAEGATWRCTTALTLLTAALFLPIRGGISTGTNHTGSVYFSSDITLNHAAVNPLFSFLESVNHQADIAGMYRFMPAAEADRLFSGMTCTRMRSDTVSLPAALEPLARSVAAGARPNVVIVMLEGFSRYIMTEAGNVQGVTPNLDRLSREGLYFTRFYANSFRTDRAIVSILSGLPAQPTMSIMDLPHKSTTLPSIARTLGKAGYETAFYYGGDADYSNMRSYLVGTGYRRVVSEDDFPKQQRTGKWGAHDGIVYGRMLDDIRRHTLGSQGKEGAAQPLLATIMTESSHEPFDVPFQGRHQEPELNAFEYADSCLGAFIDGLRGLPAWQNTLVLIVPDHLGAYPPRLHNYKLWRYHTPLIILGGMIHQPQQLAVTGSQIDIPATLLALLGHDHGDFLYSKDLLDPSAPHFAFFTVPDAMGLVVGEEHIVHDNTYHVTGFYHTTDTASLNRRAQAYLQKLYDDIAAR